jgi:transposase
VLPNPFAAALPLHLSPKVQSVMYARVGVELDRSLLAKCVGHAATPLEPLVEARRAHMMSGTKLHADDTPPPALASRDGKTKTVRLWVYVLDNRALDDMTPRCASPIRWIARASPPTPATRIVQRYAASRRVRVANEAIYEAGCVMEAACWATLDAITR